MTKLISLNRNGKRINLANIQIDVKSGNPYRNSGTGKFGFEIPGVIVIMGKRYLKGMPTEARSALANRVKLFGAREMAIKPNPETGELQVVLSTEGRILDNFTLPMSDPAEGQKPPREDGTEPQRGKKFEAAFDPADELLRDAILDAARNLNLDEDQIVAVVEKRIGRELTDAEKYNLRLEIDRQRLEDLVQYLYSNATDSNTDGMVRIRTPRGYLRRTFAGLDKIKAEKVINRLKAMGLDDETIDNKIKTQLPKRLKRELGIQEKEE